MCFLEQDILATVNGNNVLITDININDDVFSGDIELDDGTVKESFWDLNTLVNDEGYPEYDIKLDLIFL